LAVPPVELTIKGLRSFHKEIYVKTCSMRSRFSNSPIIETTYEDLVSDPDRENARLLEFLDVRVVPLKEVLAKNSSGDLSLRISGFKEFAQSLKGTAYEHLLPDGSIAGA
jgi:hypothetical protein